MTSRHIDIELIRSFDRHLQEKGLAYTASIIGGAAIMLVASSLRPTGDIDSILSIPPDIKDAIVEFARKNSIKETWFNDNASRNYREFVKSGEDVFIHQVFSGSSLNLYTPSIHTLLISKIYPMLDRADEGHDLADVENLINAQLVKIEDLEKAIATFEFEIRFEEDSDVRKDSWELAKSLRKFMLDAFAK